MSKLMRCASILLISILCGVAVAGQLAPPLDPLTEEEMADLLGRVDAVPTADRQTVLRGLVSDQTALRANCARYLASHGKLSDLPYLIDALSDDSMHVGVNYIYGGMMTTRYWANVALICITKLDMGYRWDDPLEERQKAIERWTNFWKTVRIKENSG